MCSGGIEPGTEHAERHGVVKPFPANGLSFPLEKCPLVTPVGPMGSNLGTPNFTKECCSQRSTNCTTWQCHVVQFHEIVIYKYGLQTLRVRVGLRHSDYLFPVLQPPAQLILTLKEICTR